MSDPFPAFVDTAPDSATAPAANAAGAATLGQIIGAHWTLGRQDQIGATGSAEADAYAPVRHALEQANPADDRPWYQRAFLQRYSQPDQTDPNAGFSLDTDAIWRDVKAQRATDPSFLKDVPATDAAGFSAWVQSSEKARRLRAQTVASRQRGFVQGAVGFGADLATGLTDPINLGIMGATGPIGGAAKTLAQIAARDALINGATEVAELPFTADSRARFGERMTAGDMVTDVATAAAGGALFGAGLHGAGKIVAKFAGKPDAAVAEHVAATIPADLRTPEEQAALAVVQRQATADATRPFVPTSAGMAAHADALNGAIAAVERELQLDRVAAPNAPPRPEPAPRSLGAAAALTPDSTIRFVLNDLEGGSAIAHFKAADGGTTRYGIGSAGHPNVDIANLTEDRAAAIARKEYWFPELDQADPKLAAVAFDAGWAMGPAAGKRILAEAGGDTDRALTLYRAELNRIADTVPGKAQFRRGWNNRVDKLARRLDGVEDALPTLNPAPFADADQWRTAQDAIDSEALAREGRAPPGLDVAEYADRYLAGDRDAAPPAASYEQVAAEFERRGAEPPPEPTAIDATPRRRGTIENETLLDFVARNGGIRNDEGHDLYNMRIKRMAGGGRVITRDGLGVDAMRELAAEAGFFQDRAPAEAMANTTPADFLSLLEHASERRVVAGKNLPDEEARAVRQRDRDDRERRWHEASDAADEHGLDLDDASRDELVDHFQAHGDWDRAIAALIEGHQADVLAADKAAQAHPNFGKEPWDADYDGSLEAPRIAIRGGRRATLARAARKGAADDLEHQGVRGLPGEEGGEGGAGRLTDERQAAGETGPLPDEPQAIAAQAAAFDDPAGPAATAQADSIAHDVAMDLGEQIDPAIADRQRRQAELGAKSPMRGTAEQDGTMGLGLFDAADQPGFRLDAEGGEIAFEQAMKAAEADLGAVDAARDCLAPPKGGTT